MKMKDFYQEVPNWREIYGKLDRPEYILKNGKAINCYGLLKDVTRMQDDHDKLTEENARFRELIATIPNPNEGSMGVGDDWIIDNYYKAQELLKGDEDED